MVGGSSVPSFPTDLKHLPRPRLPAEVATRAKQLSPPLAFLARELAPGRIIVDCGGHGQCGPNALVFLLRHLGRDVADAPSLRKEVATHAARESVRGSATTLRDGTWPMSFEKLVERCMQHWPNLEQLGGVASLAKWCETIVLPDAWTDVAFMQAVSDLYQVAIHVIGIDGSCKVTSFGYLRPFHPAQPTAALEIGCQIGQHFVAIGDVELEAAASPPRLRGGEQRRAQCDDRLGDQQATGLTSEGLEDEASHSYSSSDDEVLPWVDWRLSDSELSSSAPRTRGASEQRSTEDVTINEEWCISMRQVVDLTQCIAMVLFMSVLVQPLFLAHTNGYSITGMVLPLRHRAETMRRVQRYCSRLFSGRVLAFMLGQYDEHRRVFVAPVDFVPQEAVTVRCARKRVFKAGIGASFLWFTLMALRGTDLYDSAARASLSIQSFVGPTTIQTGQPTGEVVFNTGRGTQRSLVSRSISDQGVDAWRVLLKMSRADEQLRALILDEIEQGDDLLSGWAEQIKPFDLSLIPQGTLDVMPDFADARLDRVSFAPVPQPPQTSWIPRHPAQVWDLPGSIPCARGVRDLLLPEAVERLNDWLRHTQEDLSRIKTALQEGVAPETMPRDRPQPIAIGQEALKPWARGKVWNCSGGTQACCKLSDMDRLPETHLNLSFVQERLARYPDQALMSHLLEGARLEADVELQSVLVPHLTSLPLGFNSVRSELDRLIGLGWYDVTADMPFWPTYMNGQGATTRKLEVTRYRRTLEGGGPRRPTFDESGLQAVSLNEASRHHRMPRHYRTDRRPAFLEWLKARGLPEAADMKTPEELARSLTHHFSKWIPEVKPPLWAIMRDAAILGRAGEFMGTAVYGFGDDAKDFFYQLAVALAEHHKLGIVFLSADGKRLEFIVEKRLPFGLHPASNIAQRFSDALMVMFREDMDEVEWEANRRATGAKETWLNLRLQLQNHTGQPCSPIRRWTKDLPLRPDIAPPARIQDIPKGYVCPQLRLYTAYMYTDDPQFVVVSPHLAKEALRVERRLVKSLGLIMAIPEKRSLGSWSRWIGVLLVVAVGLVLVPRDKILRASVAIHSTLQGQADFRLYRALIGLLEHLRAVCLRSRNVMYGLYEPHKPTGASKYGPSGKVICTPLMRKQLEQWQRSLADSGGVSVKQAVLRSDIEGRPTLRIDAISDACLADVRQPGLGGFCHGLYWTLQVPDHYVPWVSIALLELTATLLNVIIFHPYVKSFMSADSRIQLNLKTDALTAAHALPKAKLSSPPLVNAHVEATRTLQWQELQYQLTIEHIFGDANPLADALSRQEWERFFSLCRHMNIKPNKVEVPPEAMELFWRILDYVREQHKDPCPETIRSDQFIAGALAGAQSEDLAWAKLSQQLTTDARRATRSSPDKARAATLTGSGQNAAREISAGGNAWAKLSATWQTHASPVIVIDNAERSTANQSHTTPSGPDQAEGKDAEQTISDKAWKKMALSWQPSGQREGKRRPKEKAAENDTAWEKLTRGQPDAPEETPSQPQSAVGSTSALKSDAKQRTNKRAAAGKQIIRGALTSREADEGPMGFNTPQAQLATLADARAEAIDKGIPCGSMKKIDRAWELWEHVCARHGTSPMRTADEVRQHPERNLHLLSELMLLAVATSKPKSKDRQTIKPATALAYPLAIIRMFKAWGVDMPKASALKPQIAALKSDYIRMHGTQSLIPQRAEPMQTSLVRAIQDIPDGAKVGKRAWLYDDQIVYAFRRINVLLQATAFRLGELCAHPSGEIRCLTFAHIRYRINDVIYARPLPVHLSGMTNRDVCYLTPPLSKADQHGEIHSAFPITLAFEDDVMNAAKAVVDMEMLPLTI